MAGRKKFAGRRRPIASAAYRKQLLGTGAVKAKASKWKNVKTQTADGIWHDSKKEADRWIVLLMMQRAGLILDLRRQVYFEVIPANCYEKNTRYKADFVYEEKGKQVVEDVKGKPTPEYIMKRKLMYHVHNIKILET